MAKFASAGSCAICGREETLTRHHLIPHTRHHNKRNKREFERAVVRQVVGICRPCHTQIHALLSEKELEREYNTVAKLKAFPGVACLPTGSQQSHLALRRRRTAPRHGDNGRAQRSVRSL